MNHYDAILIPGGGLTPTGAPTPWVTSRLERALEYPDSCKLVLLSAGSPHKAPPLDSSGQPIHESHGGARYLIQRGVDPHRILVETASLDTIGNAFFARVVHVEPRCWRRLLVITSAHHIARTQAIFERVFSLPRHPDTAVVWSLDFEAVPDSGLTQEIWTARRAKEEASLSLWKQVSNRFMSLQDLSEWLFKDHPCYAAGKQPAPISGRAMLSY